MILLGNKILNERIEFLEKQIKYCQDLLYTRNVDVLDKEQLVIDENRLKTALRIAMEK